MRNGSFITRFTVILPMAICLFIISCQKDVSDDSQAPGSASLQVRFNPVVDNDQLLVGKTYKNAFGEDYSVSTFKFYVHGIELINSKTNTSYRVDKNQHFLVNGTDTSRSYLTLDINPATYDQISFFVGVDSIRNVSGAQTGALDPAEGMFWTWSTGYIMAKLEGKSPVALTPSNVIEYHIGGFKGTDNVIRKVILNFPASHPLDVKTGSHSTVRISANINRWFSNVNSIHISDKPVSMSPGSLATQIADNYATMFTVVEIVNE